MLQAHEGCLIRMRLNKRACVNSPLIAYETLRVNVGYGSNEKVMEYLATDFIAGTDTSSDLLFHALQIHSIKAPRI